MQCVTFWWYSVLMCALIYITQLTVIENFRYFRSYRLYSPDPSLEILDLRTAIVNNSTRAYQNNSTNSTTISRLPTSTSRALQVQLSASKNVDTADKLSRLHSQLNNLMSARIALAKQFRDKLRKEFQAVLLHINNTNERARLLTYRPPQGGLGNFMFEFATLLGCAKKNNRIPVRYTNESRMNLFEGMELGFLDQSVLFPNNTIGNYTVGDNGPGKFTQKFHELHKYFPNQTVALSGYGQSWKYFHHVAGEIRTMYTFKESIQLEAIKTILQGISSLYETGVIANESLTIRAGIHVRRGDIVTNTGAVNHGHIPATEEYLLRAAMHIQSKYKHVVFFVLSNDVAYCRKVFREKHFVFVNGKSAEVDLAIMTFMDVMVMSVGSYGWWGAYLSDAKEVLYFKDWPRNGSDYSKRVIKEDYFLPHWQGET